MATVLVSPAQGQDASNVPVKRLDQKNPEFVQRYDAWRNLSLLYEGGAALKQEAALFLPQRPREDSTIYQHRVDQFTDQGLLGTALGWYGSAMFEVDPEIFFRDKEGNPSKDPSDFYSDFLNNCDGKGTRFIDAFKKIFSTLLTFGSAWVVTDLRALEEGEDYPATLQEQRDKGLLDPHIVQYTPLQVLDWRCDKLGTLLWVTVKTTCEEHVFLGEPEIVDTWYYWDRTQYRVYEDRRKKGEATPSEGSNRSAVLKKQGNHSLSSVNRVPVRRLELSQGLWLANRAYLSLLDHINQNNTLKWALFMSNLAIPVVIGDVDASNMTNSEAGFLVFPSGTDYRWSEPDGKSFEHSARRLDSLREEIFRSWHLQAQGRSMSATPAMQSGRSKFLEMAPARDILGGMGDDLRRCMKEVLTDVCAARQDDVTPDVRGFNFENEMTTEEVFAISSVLGLQIPSETFERHIYREVAKHWMKDADRRDLKKVYDEIEKGQTIEERMEQDLKNRIELTRAGFEAALNKKTSSGAPPQPPGRGGAGPSPK